MVQSVFGLEFDVVELSAVDGFEVAFSTAYGPVTASYFSFDQDFQRAMYSDETNIMGS